MDTKKLEVRIEEPLDLGKLRWLVEQCKDLPDNSSVKTTEQKIHSSFDRDVASITVRGETQ